MHQLSCRKGSHQACATQAAWILDDDDEDGPGDLMGSISEGEELEGEEQQEQKDEQEEAGVRVGEEETASLLGGATTAGGGATEFGDDEDADRMEVGRLLRLMRTPLHAGTWAGAPPQQGTRAGGCKVSSPAVLDGSGAEQGDGFQG